MLLKKIAGIDYSLTSPAICVYKEEDDGFFNFDGCMLYYLSNNKRQQQLAAGCGVSNIIAEPYPEWDCEEERHEKLSTWAYLCIQGCDEVFIEGYAFATSGNADMTLPRPITSATASCTNATSWPGPLVLNVSGGLSPSIKCPPRHCANDNAM